MIYKCRFCHQPMQHGKIINELIREFDIKLRIGREETWYCLECGVFITERVMDYSVEQFKEMLKEYPVAKIETFQKESLQLNKGEPQNA